MSDIEIKKLKESIQAGPMKIIDLFNKIDNGLLNTQPDYQRKLVWKKQHKYAFIDTILLNFPFPEVYIASSEIDVENMKASEVVVDGQQRLTTIVDYIKGAGDFEKQSKVKSFVDLDQNEKKEFLSYRVSVRDLKDIGEDLIKEIFQRINSTEYSLNTVEKNNAQYGDGEIAIFCKQLIDMEYKVSENETDVILSDDDRKIVFDFFNEKKVFTSNDQKRMYDFQYFMLLIATILEGDYFGRSQKVDEYLEKYNAQFTEYQEIIELLKKSIKVIDSLEFSEKSYWFNKANLFTLLIELSKFDLSTLDLSLLEFELLKLEEKVDVYFSAEEEAEISEITEEEKKYFEVARHGSHEKSARDLRGGVILQLLERSSQAKIVDPDSMENRNLKYLDDNGLSYVVIVPTETGLKKSIMDAVLSVREFLVQNGFHDYSAQEFGPDHKEIREFYYKNEGGSKKSEVSMYRSNGRGDYRIWFKELSSFADPNNKLIMLFEDGKLCLLNVSKVKYY